MDKVYNFLRSITPEEQIRFLGGLVVAFIAGSILANIPVLPAWLIVLLGWLIGAGISVFKIVWTFRQRKQPLTVRSFVPEFLGTLTGCWSGLFHLLL